MSHVFRLLRKNRMRKALFISDDMRFLSVYAPAPYLMCIGTCYNSLYESTLVHKHCIFCIMIGICSAQWCGTHIILLLLLCITVYVYLRQNKKKRTPTFLSLWTYVYLIKYHKRRRYTTMSKLFHPSFDYIKIRCVTNKRTAYATIDLYHKKKRIRFLHENTLEIFYCRINIHIYLRILKRPIDRKRSLVLELRGYTAQFYVKF